ncbi:MAG: hypothetical protein ACFB10_14925 [Salibacteraceae bacterium]
MKNEEKKSIKALAEKAQSVVPTKKLATVVGGQGGGITHDIIVWPLN